VTTIWIVYALSKRPAAAKTLFRRVWTFAIVFSVSVLALALLDDLLPSLVSSNSVCKTEGPAIYTIFYVFIDQIGVMSIWWIFDFFRPEKFGEVALFWVSVSLLTCICWVSTCILQVMDGSLYMAIFLAFFNLCISLPWRCSQRKRAQQQARKKVEADIQKYDAAWSEVTSASQEKDSHGLVPKNLQQIGIVKASSH
jgi:hypothetical protein